ncbi:MAG TPA: PIG-L deacetylase family protein [Acidimicrobiales bacterium]|nr:PIG-L deacetylase family protein [Acidimicrobiales bacterium]
MAELLVAAPARALAVYAHPDDPEISCGGTLAAWARRGSEVHVLTCTRGEKGSSDPAVDREVLARRRAKEVAAAAAVLGLGGHDQLPVDDGEVENTSELRGSIVAAIRRVRPDVVVCPDPTAVIFGDTYFNHHDHRVVGWATLDAVAPAAGNPHYFPDAGPAHQVGAVLLSGTLEPNVWVDVAATLDTKVEALACHRSQLGDEGEEWLRAVVTARAEGDGRMAGTRYAEGFRRLTLTAS